MIKKVTKIDAVKRHLDVAIKLFFEDEDPIPIYSISAASHTILKDLVKHRTGKKAVFDDWMDLYIKPEKMGYALTLFASKRNFLKHANKDPDKTIEELKPELVEMELFFCCATFFQLGEKLTDRMAIYWSWLMAQQPNLFIVEKMKDDFERLEQTGLPMMSKEYSKDHCLQVINSFEKRNYEKRLKSFQFHLP